MWNSIIDQYKSKALVACDQNYFTDFPQNAHGNIYIEFYIFCIHSNDYSKKWQVSMQHVVCRWTNSNWSRSKKLKYLDSTYPVCYSNRCLPKTELTVPLHFASAAKNIINRKIFMFCHFFHSAIVRLIVRAYNLCFKRLVFKFLDVGHNVCLIALCEHVRKDQPLHNQLPNYWSYFQYKCIKTFFKLPFTCSRMKDFGIRVVGKGSWKERVVGKF